MSISMMSVANMMAAAVQLQNVYTNALLRFFVVISANAVAAMKVSGAKHPNSATNALNIAASATKTTPAPSADATMSARAPTVKLDECADKAANAALAFVAKVTVILVNNEMCKIAATIQTRTPTAIEKAASLWWCVVAPTNHSSERV